jgi:hypothetical protein
MRALRVALAFATIGVLLPLTIMIADHMSAHGWWPNWIIYVWPTSYMFLATEAIVDGFWYETAALSIGLNALLYALVGFTLPSVLRSANRTRSLKS